MKRPVLILILLSCFLFACKKDSPSDTKNSNTTDHSSAAIFELLAAEKTNVQFANVLQENDQHNRLSYEYFYNGGGVAAGDINNDGLIDLYFTGNMTSDKLYLNKGNFKFEDISQQAGIANATGWKTGVSLIDINNDGFLDIYVCRAGWSNDPAQLSNLLYINNRNQSFTESAKAYGLDFAGHSVQSAFFDYDKDGDLDMYLLNHPLKSDLAGYKTKAEYRNGIATGKLRTDRFFINQNGKYQEAGMQAGLFNFGYRHGISIGDLNNDTYPDIYISGDFDDPDQLFINNGNGTFTDKIHSNTNHISMFSMGNDIADYNNDGHLDIIVADMTPDDHVRSKINMAPMDTKKFYGLVNSGFHYQYMVNTLQLNNGDGSFSEIGQLAGISKTDWSWSTLFADLDNDGYKDLYITNGVKRDVLNNDTRLAISSKMQAEQRKLSPLEIIQLMPSHKIKNYLFKNKKDYSFENVSERWSKAPATNSNGAVYVDLDNDGDLDLVSNNIDEAASIHKNLTRENQNQNYLKIKLVGSQQNKQGIGARVSINIGEQTQIQEKYCSRGYLSSIDDQLHFGIATANQIDQIKVEWFDGKESIFTNAKANQSLTIYHKDAQLLATTKPAKPKEFFQKVEASSLGINYQHQENPYNDFDKEILLPHKQSEHGPYLATADVNGDGLEDFFIGGAAEQAGKLFLQQANGKFKAGNNQAWTADQACEDLGVLFFDIDQDKDLDLYVVSGGNEFPEDDPRLQDRLYLNDGNGNFSKSKDLLPEMLTSGLTVKAADFDQDGDMDLFVGGRIVPAKYPMAPRSYLLENQKGKLVDVTEKLAPDLLNPGLVTDALFTDFDQDKKLDLILVGEWMPISFYKNADSTFVNQTAAMGFDKSVGLWFSINEGDFDQDGDQDFVVGNLGKNTKFKTAEDKGFHIYCSDFDSNGSLDIVLSNENKGVQLPVRGRQCSSEQMPFVKEKFPTFKQFAEAKLEDIYNSEKLEKALHFQADELKSLYLRNDGNGLYEKSALPNKAQFSPIMKTLVHDFNGDQFPDILGVGNLYGSEVETVRYDASTGFLLGGGKTITTLNNAARGFATTGNTKDMRVLNLGKQGAQLLLVTANNAALQLFKINNANLVN